MSVKSITIGFLSFIFVLLFSACSYLTDFYIQNLTSTKKIIKINYNYSVSKAIDHEPDSFGFNYENKILSPRAFQKLKNPKSLEKIEVRDSAVILEILPIQQQGLIKAITEDGGIGLKVLKLMERSLMLKN